MFDLRRLTVLANSTELTICRVRHTYTYLIPHMSNSSKNPSIIAKNCGAL